MVAPEDLARAERPAGPLRLVPVLECGPGLEHVGPRLSDEPREDLVPLANLTAAADILHLTFGYRLVTDEDPHSGGLPGGHALFAGETLLARPTCCGELGDAYVMADLVADEYSRTTATAGWMELWVGHPCWVVHVEGEDLFLGPGVEPDSRHPISPEPDEPIWRLPLGEFIAAARLALAEVEAAVPRWQAALAAGMTAGNALISARGVLGLQVGPDPAGSTDAHTT